MRKLGLLFFGVILAFVVFQTPTGSVGWYVSPYGGPGAFPKPSQARVLEPEVVPQGWVSQAPPTGLTLNDAAAAPVVSDVPLITVERPPVLAEASAVADGPDPVSFTVQVAVPSAVDEQPQPIWLEDGKFISFQRKSPQSIHPGDKIKFEATLANTTQSRFDLVAEVVVRKGDGTLETLIPNYKLRLRQGKQLHVPVGMSAKAKRFPPGVTQFIAFLRDRQGEIVDQASITFEITLPLP